MTPPCRPELELLLGGARTRVPSHLAERMRTLAAAGLDWPWLIRAAEMHGVSPLLSRSLSGVGPSSVPAAVLEQLRRDFHSNARHNLLLTRELLRLLRLLEEAGIQAIAYKGPMLAAAAYGSVLFRRYADLDILMRREEIPRARALLAAHGYQPRYPMTEAEEAAFLMAHHDYELVRADGAINVELQWGVTEASFSFPLDFERLWANAEALDLEGTIVRTLAPDELLLILCVHGAKHRWERIGWICDVAELVHARPDLAWPRLRAYARARGAERMLSLGLSLARDLLGAELPPEMAVAVDADTGARALAIEVVGELLTGRRAACGIGDEDPVFYFRMRERARDRARLAARYAPAYLRRALTPNDRDRAAVRLPRSLSGLYYLVRPLRLAREAVARH